MQKNYCYYLIVFYNLYWYVCSLYGFLTIEHSDFFKCIVYSDHIKTKTFFSKFWNSQFLCLTIAFKGWCIFSNKGSKFSNFGILRLITAFEKKLLCSIATSSLFVIKMPSSSASFIPSEDWTSFDRTGLTVFQKKLFSVMCFSFKLVK